MHSLCWSSLDDCDLDSTNIVDPSLLNNDSVTTALCTVLGMDEPVNESL